MTVFEFSQGGTPVGLADEMELKILCFHDLLNKSPWALIAVIRDCSYDWFPRVK